jgi:hypothetical protein
MTNTKNDFDFWQRQMTQDRANAILKQFGETDWLQRMKQKHLPKTVEADSFAARSPGDLDLDPMGKSLNPLMSDVGGTSSVCGSEELAYLDGTPICRGVPNQYTAAAAHLEQIAEIGGNPEVCRIGTPFNLIEEALRSNFKLKGVPNQHTSETARFLRNESEASPQSASPPSEEEAFASEEDEDFSPEDRIADEDAAAHPSTPRRRNHSNTLPSAFNRTL